MAISIRGKFRERKYSFLNKKKKQKEKEKEEQLKKKKEDENIFKIIIFSPLIIFGFVKNIIDYFSAKAIIKSKKIDLKEDKITKINIKKSIISHESITTKYNKIDNISNTKIIQNKRNKNIIIKEENKKNTKETVSSLDINNLDSLELTILLKIKKKLNKLNNECDIIESDAYLIRKYSNDKNLLDRAIQIRKEINELEEKLNKISNEIYNIKEKILINPELIKDEDLEYNIIRYKQLIEDIEESKLPNKIKLLEEYKKLLIKINNLEITTNNLEKESTIREEELLKRDNRYKIAKEKMANLDQINSKCDSILQKNKNYIYELSSKIGIISKKKYTKYKLQGLNNLLSTSLKYIGLLSLTPLRGIIPGIAAKTFATRRLINGMYQNLHYEKHEKIVYSFENYYSEISSRIYNIDLVEKNIELALSDINNLKSEFKNNFLSYTLKEYDEAYKKIELLEQDILNNKEKMAIIKNRLVENQKINKDTLTKVRKLNTNSK